MRTRQAFTTGDEWIKITEISQEMYNGLVDKLCKSAKGAWFLNRNSFCGATVLFTCKDTDF